MTISPVRLPVFLLLLAVALSHCAPKERPGILDKDQMASLLTDFYLKEARMKAEVIPVDSAVLLFTHLRQRYSAAHGFPDSLIDASFDHYLRHPAEMDEVFDRVIDSLSLREQRMGAADIPEP